MFFAGGEKTVQRELIFADVGVNEQSVFGMQRSEAGESGKRNLDDVADASDFQENLIRTFVDEFAAQRANHAERLLISGAGLSNAGHSAK
jgi:hypothetical protein